MGIISKMRKQDAVYWAPTKADEFGRPGKAVPIDIKCRWDDEVSQFINPKTGTLEISNSKVYVDRDVLLGGYLWLGTVATIPGGNGVDPQTIEGALPIRMVSKNPNIKATDFLRTAVL